METRPLLLQAGLRVSRSPARVLASASAHLVADADVCTVVQQVLHHSEVSTAACCDEGRVAALAVLTVELRRVFREDSEQPTDVSSIR